MLRPSTYRARGRGAGPGAGRVAALAVPASAPVWPALPDHPAIARAAPAPVRAAIGRPRGRARCCFRRRVGGGQGGSGPWWGGGSWLFFI